jgi:hypothetical protein
MLSAQHSIAIIFVVFSTICVSPGAFSWVTKRTTTTATRGKTTHTTISTKLFGNEDNGKYEHNPPYDNGETSRRIILKKTMRAGTACVSIPLLQSMFPDIALAAADQRCDPIDPRCGADGKFLSDGEEKNRIKPIPRVTNKITHVVQLVIDVGERREEVGFIRFGLYGDDCPTSVRTMIQFLTTIGITGVGKEQDDIENLIDVKTQPVSLLYGGVVPSICPGQGIEFGVPSQKKAYAKSRGLGKAGDNFLPQSRPLSSQKELSARTHTVAGLISVPEKGIGYGNGNGPIDEAYANAFLITASDDSSELFDTKLHRRVIGQIIDNESMEFLARLASLPIQKNKGTPLLKVTVLDAGVQKVGQNTNTNDNNKKK